MRRWPRDPCTGDVPPLTKYAPPKYKKHHLLSRARARLDNAERLDKLQDERIEVLQHVQAYLVAQRANF